MEGGCIPLTIIHALKMSKTSDLDSFLYQLGENFLYCVLTVVYQNLCRGALDCVRAKCAKNFATTPILSTTPTILSGHAYFEVCTIKNQTYFC